MIDINTKLGTVVGTFKKLQKDGLKMLITTEISDITYNGRIVDVGLDYISVQQEPVKDDKSKSIYTFYPELIRIDKIVSVRRDSNCKTIKKIRNGGH